MRLLGWSAIVAFALCACASFGATPEEPGADGGAPDATSGGGPRSGLVLALDFEDATATSAQDSSGRGNHGTVFGGARVSGVRGNALDFAVVGRDGSTSVLVPASTSLDIGGSEITIAFWISIPLPLPEGDQVVLTKAWTSGSMTLPYYQYGVELNRNSKTLQLFVGEESSSPARVSVTPAFGDAWTHVAFVVGAGAATGYVNGVASAPEPLTIPITRRGTALSLGIDAVGGQPFAGVLDEVRIYDRALTAAEVGQLAAR